MSLLIELNPKLNVTYCDGSSPEVRVKLKTDSLYKLLSQYKLSCSMYLACGGNIGNEIEGLLKKDGVLVHRIDIKDSTPIDSTIITDTGRVMGLCPEARLTFDDTVRIKDNFVACISQDKSVVFPIYKSESEFAHSFLRKLKDYYRISVIFGDEAINYLNDNPDYCLITKDDVQKRCPFKIMSEQELMMYSYSLVENRDTRLIITTDSSILFFKRDKCFEVMTRGINRNMILLGIVFAIENDYPSDELIAFLAACNRARSDATIGDIATDAKKIKIGVMHR